MTHEEAFLHDIIQNPNDDTPRQIFTDWLDDHGQPERAEFIRVQLELARLGPDNSRGAVLQEREEDLLAEYGACWRAPLRALGATQAKFRRGLIEEVQLDDAPASQVLAVLRAAPIRTLRLWATDGRCVASLARFPELARLHELVIRSRPRNRIGSIGTACLAESPYLSGLHSLAILGDQIGADGVRALALSPYLSSLKQLTLHCNHLRDDSALILAESPLLPKLRSLGLGWNDIGEVGMRALLASPSCCGLERLDLELNAFSGAIVARMLAEASHLRRLTDLNVSDSNVGQEGASALASAPQLASLKKLVLQSFALGDEGVRTLARSPYLAGLQELWLCHNGVTTVGIGVLGEAVFWPGLRHLTLNDESITDQGIEALHHAPALTSLGLWNASVGPEGMRSLAHKSFPCLEKLDLCHLPLLGDEGLECLLAGPGLPGLKSLWLRQTGLTARGAIALAESPLLANLKELWLEECIGNEGARSLASSPRAGGLRVLSMCGCEVGDEGGRALAESLHLAGLRELSLYRNGYCNSTGVMLRERFGDRVRLA